MELISSLLNCLLLFTYGALAAWPTNSPLIVKTAPTSPQPYVLPRYQGFAFYFQGQVGRVLVSNETSNGAFTLVVGNSGLTIPGAVHKHTHLMEAWYVTKGSNYFWFNDEGRRATQNDFHMYTQGNNHTYGGSTDPDSELLLALTPGGVEKLLLALGAPYNSTTNAPYNPLVTFPVNATLAVGLGPQYDTFFEPTATINHDFLNGTTPNGNKTWHIANQTLPGYTTPYFISSNNGPKYLERSSNQVIQPLATGAETDKRVTLATIAMAANTNGTPKTQSFPVHQALQVLEGQLTITMGGNTVNLIQGDTAFVPSGTEFSYQSCVAWTKVWAYAPTGGECLVTELLKTAEAWLAPVFPIN